MPESGIIETTENVNHGQLEKPKPDTERKPELLIADHGEQKETQRNDGAKEVAMIKAALEGHSQQSASQNTDEVQMFEIPREEVAPLLNPLAKMRKAITGTTKKDLEKMEKMEKLYYTQEGLLQLVKAAESEARKSRESKTEKNPSETNQSETDGPMDMSALTDEARQLDLSLEANEARFSELIDKENSGKLTSDEVKELIQIWKDRDELEKGLEINQHKQGSHTNLLKDKMIGLLDRSLKNLWKSFNARSNTNQPLEELKLIANSKAGKSGRTDFAIPPGASPSRVAGMITQLQSDALRKK